MVTVTVKAGAVFYRDDQKYAAGETLSVYGFEAAAGRRAGSLVV